MHAHTGAVNFLLPASNSSFLSCGTDKLVILWRDGRQAELRRSAISQQMMHGHANGDDDDSIGEYASTQISMFA